MRAGALIAAVAALGIGSYWFQPWKLWQDETVREALPNASPPNASLPNAAPPSTAPTGTGVTPPASRPSPAAGGPSDAPAGPRTLALGTLISHEHATTGTAKLLLLPDGSRTLRLENLDTSNGPDLRVWLTDAPVKEGVAGWSVFDDGKYVSLGKLKGNKGDQNYEVPAGVDLADYSSVTIWCDRFDVSFGAAALGPA
ncbi:MULTISPECIES: DM13 domain-containing protein [unclassified Streptomyces]|uniref:DM13 domain-containing protein n=1 Tax=unclassified Streptomyces TaxID=2593676 RepID=UPI001EF965A2|nr:MULTISPECIES: DM13 domain-containing protein [unclassified Streptomyces]